MPDLDQYLQTLLTYYEEEVAGEFYFFRLADYFEEQEKLMALSKVEKCAAQSIEPLLEKYQLRPRATSVLRAEGEGHVFAHANMTWMEFVTYMAQRYPLYLDDFDALENMAPKEDREALQRLTRHEVAAIEFAKAELIGDAESLRHLTDYISQAGSNLDNGRDQLEL